MNNLKILCIVQDYPSEKNRYPMAFVHTRMIEYVKHNIEVDVLSFSANNNYRIDNINVITEKEAIMNIIKYDVFIFHAPNIRNHCRFIISNWRNIGKMIFFFHGHEIMNLNEEYPEQYDYVKKNKCKKYLQLFYDKFKLFFLHYFFTYVKKKKVTYWIFVSKWMYKIFIKNINIDNVNFSIINNLVDRNFLCNNYCYNELSKFDFITIRPFDNSKYCIDLVVKIAELFPEKTFHIFGKGRYFEYYKKPRNVSVYNRFFESKELVNLLSNYKCALMPTRLDAQGVMNCEIASLGMPLITSNLSISKEMLQEFDNICFIDNNCLVKDEIEKFLKTLKLPAKKILKFNVTNTIYKEIEILKNI